MDILLPVMLLIASAHVRADMECAEDERYGLGLLEVTDDAVVLREFRDKTDPDDCYAACCNLIESEGCSAATFYSENEKYVCKLMNCQPFSKCRWKNQPFAYSARIALIDSQLLANFTFETGTGDEDNDEQDYDTGTADTTLDWLAEEEEEEEELEEEAAVIFKGDDNWNVDIQSSTAKASDVATQIVEDSNVWGDSKTWEESDTGSWSGGWANNQPPAQPASGFGNDDDLFGQLDDMDNGLSPMTIFGIIVFVLTAVFLLTVLARRLVQAQRLTYRPLGDKLNPPTDYDADDWDEVNTHLVRTG